MITKPKRLNVLRLPDVKKKTGLKHDAIYRLGRAGLFPKAIKLSERASGWIEDELDLYLQRCADARDGGAGAGHAAP